MLGCHVHSQGKRALGTCPPGPGAPTIGPTEAACLPLGSPCERRRVARDEWPETGALWPSSPSTETVNQVDRESLYPWAYFLLWIPLPCTYLLLSFPRILWSYIPGPPLVGAGERGLGEAGRCVIIVPCTLPQTGSIFSIYRLSCF